MSRGTRSVRWAALTCALLLGTPWAFSLADRLHLDGGGVIEVHSWWIDDGIVYYRDADGTIGLPRSIVLEIEPAEAPDGQPAGATNPQPSAGAISTARTPVKKARAPRAVPHEIAAGSNR